MVCKKDEIITRNDLICELNKEWAHISTQILKDKLATSQEGVCLFWKACVVAMFMIRKDSLE